MSAESAEQICEFRIKSKVQFDNSQPLAKLDARPILRHEIYIILEPKKLNLGKRNIFKGHVDLCLRGEDGD